jgi:hypothetical protein
LPAPWAVLGTNDARAAAPKLNPPWAKKHRRETSNWLLVHEFMFLHPEYD